MDGMVRTIRVARALLLGGRMVCLDGLDTQVEVLCARCLAANPDDKARLRARLLGLRAELDVTMPLLEASAGEVGCISTTS